MMKKFTIIFGLMVCLMSAEAQQFTTIADVKFSTSIPAGWTVSPAGGWAIDTHLYVSTPSSILGYVPNSIGDSVVLTSPYYDLRAYSYVFLRFSHICKVTSSDICKVYLQENYTGAKWKELPSASYQGSNTMAYRNNRFSHESYSDWVPADSLATPNNAWWKTEPFDISDEASFAQVRFKFVIKRGNVLWTQFAYGWLIDDFELMASNYQIAPPVVEILSSSPIDTVYNTGPFTVTAKIVSRTTAPMKVPIYLKLTYKYNNITTYDSIQMINIEGDSIWAAIIPQQLYGTSISYSINATDTFGNHSGDLSSFYLKRFTGGNMTGYVTVGYQTNNTYYNILNYDYDYSWTRQLYLGTEINPSGTGGLITKIAFQPTSTWSIGNQKCYLKAVDEMTISNNNYLDPLYNGYTLAWSGTYNLAASSWSEITLNAPFVLPSGKNLMVYWFNEDGSYTNNISTAWYATSTSPNYRAVYKFQDGSLPLTAGTLYYYRPDIRLYVVAGIDDSVSVSLYSIDNPKDSVVAAPSHQVPVIVTVKNEGLGVLDSCLINWTLNGELKPSRKWKGHLLESFMAHDTIGFYMPSLNQYDTIVAWVSMPNGIQDSVVWDDTLSVIAYGVTGLNMEFLSNVTDTIYNTGPFMITSLISSRTAAPVPSPVYLHVAYTYNAITIYDSIVMNKIANDTFQAIIPQHTFGTNISYYIELKDAVGNNIMISDSFYVKRPDDFGNGDTNSVVLFSIDYPSVSILTKPGANPVGVIVTIKNIGLGNLTSCQLGWSLNGIYQGSKIWTGNLIEDFNDTITVGYYIPRPGIYDEITVWVSLPNGVIDNFTDDDTLSTSIYGQTKIYAELNGPIDTVKHTGLYFIDARIYSLSQIPTDTTIYLYVSYTYSGTTTYDTILMANSGNDTLFTAELPKQAYTSSVSYAISITDSLGNIVNIKNEFYVKRPGVNDINDSIWVATVASGGVFVVPFDYRIQVSYSRIIYHSNELGSDKKNVRIAGIGWQSYNAAAPLYSYPINKDIRKNQSIYMLAVDKNITTITNSNYFDPITNGYTKVWEGDLPLSDIPGTWHMIEFDSAFTLPKDKNLIVYYIDQDGNAHSSTFIWRYASVSGSCGFGYGSSISNITYNTTEDYKPFTFFGIASSIDDSNSIALDEIISPQSFTSAGANTAVQVIIRNKGIKNLTSCRIDWKLNGTLQTPYIWTGNLYDDFTDTVTIGSYLPTINHSDQLIIWVNNPNGELDSTNSDDTLSVVAFGKAGIVAEFIPPYVIDTIYHIGPYRVNAHIQSLTSLPVLSPTLYYSTTLNGITTNDSVLMINVFPDSLWRVNIPQQAFGTTVKYYVSVIDSIGNLIVIRDSFYVKRPGGLNIVDSIQVGTSLTGGDYSYPFNTNGSGNNWSRSLYHSQMLGNVNHSVTIAGISYVTSYNYSYTRYYTKCYLKATSATVIGTSNTYSDPINDGAAKVYEGTWTTRNGWNQFIFDSSFVLPKGQNLLVYWVDTSSLNQCSNTSAIYWATNQTSALGVNYSATDRHYTNSYCQSSGGGSTNYLPTTLFYYGGKIKDSNSVSLRDVLSPADTVQSYQSTPIRVVIKNEGTNNLTSCIINWTINGIAQTTYSWTGNLPEEFEETVTLGYFTPMKGNTYNFTFTVTLPNNVYDSMTYDNVLTQKTYADFKGKNLTMQYYISPINNTYEVCFPESTAVRVRVANTGSVALMLNNEPVMFHYKVNGPISYQDSIVISKGIFAVGTKDIIIDTILDVNLPGIYHFEIYLSCASDTLHFDDTIRMDYNVKKLSLPYDNDFSTITSDLSFIQNAGYVKWVQDPNPAMTPVYGTGALYFNSAIGAGHISTAMMKSINLKGTLLPTLEFWFAHDAMNAAKQDKIEVKISTNGYAFSTLQTITRYDSNFTTPGWKKYTIDLSNYTSETCVIISFVATSAGGGNMWIDRIAISSAQELGINLDIPTEADLIACDLGHKEIKVNVSNNTLLPIDFNQTPVILKLEITGAKTLSYADTLTGILNGNTDMDIVLDNDFDFTLNGIYHFRAYITSIDDIPDNDTAMSSVVISPDIYLISIDSIGIRAIKEHVYPSVLLRNTGNLTIKDVPLRIKVNGANDITETAYLELAAGSDTLYTFNTPYVVPLEPTYDLMILTELSCDPVRNNDTLRSTENVNEPYIQVQNVLRPSSTICDSGLSVIYPQIVINNTGTPDIDVVVYLSMDTASNIFASFVDTIAFVLSGTTTYNFTKSYVVPNMPTNSTYNVKAYIYSPTYTFSQTACVIYKKDDDNVLTQDKDNWTLGQNIPNPAQLSLVIPYTVPHDGNVIFKIMSINGQVLYSNIMHVLKGNHQIEHNIASFADGIYYYSMEYEGERIIKKMTIQK